MKLFEQKFEGYAYSYPHKHSYRPLQPMQMKDVWATENKEQLFLYIHLPFCEMRCGFCNLFTIANPQEDMVDAYLQTLTLERDILKDTIQPKGFGQLAIGGGTPTFLSVAQLEKLFDIIAAIGADVAAIPSSVETSPKTIDTSKLQLLKQQGVTRVSMGVQSFLESELKSLGRPQKNREVYDALDLLQKTSFPVLNLDLIYGAYGQTMESWLFSLREVVKYKVQELFIYPLYVRPLTGINKLSQEPTDHRWLFYKEAKAFLLSNGYEQVSMRMFRRLDTTGVPFSRYTCQEDGMVGMGAGARSYTRSVHYSSEYAVARQYIKSIISQYISKQSADFATIDYGIILSQQEQQTRYVIKSLLHSSGLDVSRFEALYQSSLLLEYPQLLQLQDEGLMEQQHGLLKLTSAGIDHSDAIGPWLYSPDIRERINTFELQ